MLEKEGKLYLYVKTAERCHTPDKMWERFHLGQDFAKSLEIIDRELEYWPTSIVLKCKQRLTKLTQMLIRMKRLSVKIQPKLVRINKKLDRREAAREKKAVGAAMIERAIEKELLARLHKGVYPNSEEILNTSAVAFNAMLDSANAQADADNEEDADADSEIGLAEYVEDFDEDLELASDNEADAGQQDVERAADPSLLSKLMSRKRGREDGAGSAEGARSAKRRRHVELEVETEPERAEAQLHASRR